MFIGDSTKKNQKNLQSRKWKTAFSRKTITTTVITAVPTQKTSTRFTNQFHSKISQQMCHGRKFAGMLPEKLLHSNYCRTKFLLRRGLYRNTNVKLRITGKHFISLTRISFLKKDTIST